LKDTVMQRYIAILRGINVGGKHKISMTELKKVLEKTGIEHIQTYIQSGNVIFSSDESDPAVLTEQISSVIKDHWGFEVPVIILSKREIDEIILTNPFADIYDPACLHITFLSAVPQSERIKSILELKDSPNDISIINRAVYLYCPNGYSKTRITNSFLERKLNLIATTRNLKTSLVLQQMAG